MLKNSVVPSHARIWMLFVFCTLTLLTALASAQSEDDVHIVPRSKPTVAAPDPGIVPSDAAPGLFSRTQPLKVSVDLVLVPVAVSDALNRPVMTLAKQDFSLFEDDKAQEIRYFSKEGEPVSVAILVDTSKSMTDKIDTERAAIREFFENADPRDEYFAIAFSSHPTLLAASTQSVDDLQTKLTTVEPGGSTAMLDAVYLAESVLRSARYKRKAIVIISDGGDNASRYTLREIRRLVEECDAQIYAIGLFETFFFNTLEERMGKRWLSEITDRTGGHTITVDDRAKLPQAAAEISREIRNEYVLGYRPARAKPDRWRRIRLQVTAKFGDQPFRAYYKKGYITAEP
jgi:Ca-activated chloride channel family protein